MTNREKFKFMCDIVLSNIKRCLITIYDNIVYTVSFWDIMQKDKWIELFDYIKSLHIIDFTFLKLFAKRKILWLWFVINICYFKITTNKSIIYTIVLYLIIFLLANSKYVDIVARKLSGFRRVATFSEKERLNYIFDNVYKSFKEQSNLKDNIELFIVDEACINAFALNNSIAITRMAIDTLDDEQISGMIAHELSHILNQDTQLHIIIQFSTNIYLSIIYLSFAIINFLVNIFIENPIFRLLSYLFKAVQIMMNSIVKVWEIICGGSSRKCEYRADCTASEHGYSEEMLSVLYELYNMQMSDKKRLIDQLCASHPPLAYRIERLEIKECL